MSYKNEYKHNSQKGENMTVREDGVVVIDLKGREADLPRNKAGDIAFECLEDIQDAFEDTEITVLVNRALYHMEYQKEHHKNYSQKQRDLEAPVKAAAKRLFPGVAWIRLTPEQHSAALNEAYPLPTAKES
jgi:hypothetical protein